jgi:sec-independent protein translocase protein TatA
MPSIGWPELLIVLVIALVIFGPKRLPDMGRQLGRGLREFRKATSEIQDHFDLSLEDKEDKDKETGDDVRPMAATVPVAEATAAETPVVQGPTPEAVDADAQVPAPEAVGADAQAPEAADADAQAPKPEVDTDAPEVVEGEVVGEEADHPAQTVAG